MAFKKNKKKPVKRKKARPKKKKTYNFQKKLKALMPKFLQNVGAFTIFVIIFMILSGIFVVQWVERTQERNWLIQQEEIAQEERENFILTLVPVAQRLQRQYGILASISLAQAAVESNFGQSQLSALYNNLYGVKTDVADESKVLLPTLEFVDNEWIGIEDYFKVYPSWDASMESHAQLIYHGTSWDANFYDAVLAGSNYVEQAHGLQEAGYATDPDYANKLIEMIEAWELYQYDQPVS